jgi:hypothetical protein
MRFCSVLDSDGPNAYRVTGTGKAKPTIISESTSEIEDEDTVRTPLFHSPVQELFRKKASRIGGRGLGPGKLGPGRISYILERKFLIRTSCWVNHISWVLHTIQPTVFSSEDRAVVLEVKRRLGPHSHNDM